MREGGEDGKRRTTPPGLQSSSHSSSLCFPPFPRLERLSFLRWPISFMSLTCVPPQGMTSKSLICVYRVSPLPPYPHLAALVDEAVERLDYLVLPLVNVLRIEDVVPALLGAHAAPVELPLAGQDDVEDVLEKVHGGVDPHQSVAVAPPVYFKLDLVPPNLEPLRFRNNVPDVSALVLVDVEDLDAVYRPPLSCGWPPPVG